VFRDDEWRLMQGHHELVAVLRRDGDGWAPYRGDGTPLGASQRLVWELREQVVGVLGLGHVMVSNYTTD
jgi:hypothetical protein